MARAKNLLVRSSGSRTHTCVRENVSARAQSYNGEASRGGDEGIPIESDMAAKGVQAREVSRMNLNRMKPVYRIQIHSLKLCTKITLYKIHLNLFYRFQF